MQVKRVGIVDDQEIFRRGVASTLAEDPGLEVVFSVAEGELPEPVDALVISSGALAQAPDDCPVVVLLSEAEPAPFSAEVGLTIGALVDRATVTAEELVATVRAVAAGLRVDRDETGGDPAFLLDTRRREILRLLAEGAHTREISEFLCYSERTIKTLIQDMVRALGARNRAHAVAEGIRQGLI